MRQLNIMSTCLTTSGSIKFFFIIITMSHNNSWFSIEFLYISTKIILFSKNKSWPLPFVKHGRTTRNITPRLPIFVVYCNELFFVTIWSTYVHCILPSSEPTLQVHWKNLIEIKIPL